MPLSQEINLGLEGARFVLSQKKRSEDSTQRYSLRPLTFVIGRRCAPYNSKLRAEVIEEDILRWHSEAIK